MRGLTFKGSELSKQRSVPNQPVLSWLRPGATHPLRTEPQPPSWRHRACRPPLVRPANPCCALSFRETTETLCLETVRIAHTNAMREGKHTRFRECEAHGGLRKLRNSVWAREGRNASDGETQGGGLACPEVEERRRV